MSVIGKVMESYLGGLDRFMLVLISWVLLSVQAVAADPITDKNLNVDQKTDLDTGAIEPMDSVRNNPDLIYVLEILLRAPVSQLKDGEPPYDQEPPDAQNDFRTRVEPPVPTEPPVPPPPPTEPPQPPPPPPTEPPSFPSQPPIFPGFPVNPPDNPPPNNPPPDNPPPNPRPPRIPPSNN